MLKAIGHAKESSVEDTVVFQYLTMKWGTAARMELREEKREGRQIKLEAHLLDTNGTLCLNARDRVWFGITGDGTLLDNQGTSSGSRCVELFNGKAEISVVQNHGASVVSARCKTVPTAFLTIK